MCQELCTLKMSMLQAWDQQENYHANYAPQHLGPWEADAEKQECVPSCMPLPVC